MRRYVAVSSLGHKQVAYSSPMASLVLTDSSQLTSDSQHLGLILREVNALIGDCMEYITTVFLVLLKVIKVSKKMGIELHSRILLADLIEIKVERPTSTEMSVLGVGFLAGLYSGIGKVELEEVNSHLRGGRVENHLGKKNSVHPTETRTSISPCSAVELNTTSALVNYATEAVYIGALTFMQASGIMSDENIPDGGTGNDLGQVKSLFVVGRASMTSEALTSIRCILTASATVASLLLLKNAVTCFRGSMVCGVTLLLDYTADDRDVRPSSRFILFIKLLSRPRPTKRQGDLFKVTDRTPEHGENTPTVPMSHALSQWFGVSVDGRTSPAANPVTLVKESRRDESSVVVVDIEDPLKVVGKRPFKMSKVADIPELALREQQCYLYPAVPPSSPDPSYVRMRTSVKHHVAGTVKQVKEGFGNHIDLCRDRGLNPGPPAQRSDTLPLDHQVTHSK
uniref:Uncharacterized protein n=1 Tax=Timema shepardi TaxID=629360 RepID=A0A7R9ASB5_TIMSH|nr:unnamed protein product [Timema shepardi]